jgi:hypothetical protein
MTVSEAFFEDLDSSSNLVTIEKVLKKEMDLVLIDAPLDAKEMIWDYAKSIVMSMTNNALFKTPVYKNILIIKEILKQAGFKNGKCSFTDQMKNNKEYELD